MKLFIFSDIHGDSLALDKTIVAFEQTKADYMVCLGDLLNHGPRNALPAGYSPMTVATNLNKMKERLISVRGNCDSEVDQALCEFPMMSEYNQLVIGQRRAFFCHGHTFTPEALPTLATGDIFVSGHTHIAKAYHQQGIYILNPGSVAIPRGESKASFALMDEHKMEIVDLNTHQSLMTCPLN